ncbi:MAG: site-specific integrase [Bacteriovoracaceae bacterium]|nr:site-specific integrase [Bacteriovoracaceae bacterium]
MTSKKSTPVNMSNNFNNLDLLNLQTQFFTELKKAGRSPNTLKNYKTDLDCFNQYLKDVQKNLDIKDFSIPQVQQYGNYLENRYNSDNSRRRRVQALRMFFDFLVEENIFPNNPVRKIPTSPKFLDIPRPTPFVDVKTLWEYLLDESNTKNKVNRLLALRNQLSLLFIFGAGLKVSDMAKLKSARIFIDKKEGARVMVDHPKRDAYTIPLPQVFEEVYQTYLDELAPMKKSSNIEFDEVLFNANPYRILSGGLSPRGLEIIFEDFRKKLSIKLTPKSLRQACIFKWLQQGHSDNLIKEWMGVAPSYSMKLYKDHLENNAYDDSFLKEIRDHFLTKAVNKKG